jgi:4-amino-4-deoxy-L-arabinose transferase-like glycosyltransferase
MPQFPILKPTLNYAAACLFAAVLILGIVIIHTLQAEGRNYAQDEVSSVWESAGQDWYHNFMATATEGDVHPPLWIMLSDVWVALFGHLESVTRYLATLGTMLTLAFTYRFGADLFNRQTGLIAVFCLGMTAFFKYFGHEYRPYFILVGGTVALNFFFLRWVRRPNFVYALCYVLTGVAILYTHYFSFYILAGQVLIGLLLVRWKKQLLLKACGLFLAIGFSYLGWILVFLQTILVIWSHGIWYGIPGEPLLIGFFLDWVTNIFPDPLGRLVLLYSVFLMIQLVNRKRRYLPQATLRMGKLASWLYLWGLMGIMLVLAFIGNLAISSLTARNLIILVPIVSLISAASFATLPRLAKWAVVPVILIIGINSGLNYRVFRNPQYEFTPYHEILAEVAPQFQSGARVIIDSILPFKHMNYWYVLHLRFPEDIPESNAFHLFNFDESPAERPAYQMLRRIIPRPSINNVEYATQIDLTAFDTFLKDAQQVWFIRDIPTHYGQQYLDALNRDFVVIKRVVLYDEPGTATKQELIGFQRRP